MIRRLLLLVLLLLPLGCSLKQMAVKSTSQILEDGIAAFEAEPDPTLAREAAAAQIKLLETLHVSDPENERVLLALTRSLASYAFAFLEQEAETDPKVRQRAAALYDRAKNYGLALLEREPHGREAAVRFWTGYAWAGAIRKSATSPLALAALPRAVALVEKSLEMDPTYHYGAAHLFMGVYYADRPRLLGGNPTKSRHHFTKAREIAQDRYVMAKYLQARYQAVQIQDLQLFRQLLNEIMQAPDDLLPEQRLAHEIAQEWAEDLLTREAHYFVEEDE